MTQNARQLVQRRAMCRPSIFLLALCVAGCDIDVVLGRNFPADSGVPGDSGSDGGGQVDGGDAGSDAGFDAGTDGGTDAGVDAGFDAGFDAGSDAGTDAGLDAGDDGGVDAGTDAGIDAGFDAGFDAGPPNLRLELRGPLTIELGTTETYFAVVSNDGGQDSMPISVSVAFPGEAAFVSGSGCVKNGVALDCDAGVVSAFVGSAAPSAQITVTGDAGRTWYQVTAQAGVLTATKPLVVTGVGVMALPIIGRRDADVTACFGSNIFSYSQCTPASLIYDHITFLPDGGMTADAGYAGIWGQSPHLRNLGFRLLNPFDGGIGTSFSGASVDSTCFQGVITSPQGMLYIGGFRACLN